MMLLTLILQTILNPFLMNSKTRVIAHNMLSTIKQNGEQSEKKLSSIEQQLELMSEIETYT
jgi:hypothetical protein